MADVKGPKILRGDWNADFTLALASKDMRLAFAFARKIGQRAPLTEAARKVYARTEGMHGGEDVCSLYRCYIRKDDAP